MIESFKWLVLISGSFFTIFGCFSYWRNREEATNRFFGLLSIAFAIWSYGWFGVLLIKDNQTAAIFWSRVLIFGATFIPVFYLHWILAFLDMHRKRKILLVSSYVVTIIFAGFNWFTNYYISGVHPIYFFPFWPSAGPLFIWYLIFGYAGINGYALFLLIREFLRSEKERRYQAAYLLIGTLAGFAGGVTNFPLMYGLTIFNPVILFIGVCMNISCSLIFSYGVIRHRLMEVKVISAELLISLFVVLLLVDALLSGGRTELILKLGLVFGMAIFAVLLIRGILNEIKSREKLAEMTETLQLANIELQKLDKAKSEFLNIASHQLRTPISVIKGITSMMIEGDLEKMPAEKKQTFIRGIWEKSQKLESIINDILNAAEMTNQEYTAKTKKDDHFDLLALLKEIIEGFQPLVKEREIDLSLEASDEPILISGEKEYLREALSNLIDNAIKYTPSTGVNSESRDKRGERGKIVVTMEKDFDNVTIEITDNGMGIPANEIPSLFKKFSRASNARNMYTDGSGLGLFIVKEIIEGHGGQINLTSEIDKGTTFHVKLPLHSLGETDIKKYIIDKQQV